jgi:uncharacterized membrane protein YbhN (UPF0104 family)
LRDRFRAQRHALVAAASLACALLAAWLVVRRAGLGADAVLRGVPPRAHALALAACATELLARGLRVALAARGLGLRVPLRTTVRAQIAGDALAAITPARVGADAAKLGVLLRSGVAAGPAGALLLAEVTSEAAMLVLCAAAIVAFTDAWWVALGPVGYAIVVTSTAAAALYATRSPRADPPPLWRRLGGSPARWRTLRLAARSFHAHVLELRRMPARYALATLAAAFLHVGARLAVLPALVLPLGAGAEEPAQLVLRPFFVLYATSLLPPPGGAGGVEVTFSAVLTDQLPAAVLAPALIWWRLYTFYLVALIGWLHLVVARLPRHEGQDTQSPQSPAELFTTDSESP